MISYHPRTFHDYDASKYSEGYQTLGITGVEQLGIVMRTYVWSPIIWKNGSRSNDNFIRSDFIGLDFDDGMTIDDAINTFCDTQCVIGTTKSHRKEKKGRVCDRFRLVIKLQQPITKAAIYTAKVTEFIQRYEADTACKDAGRFFWPCEKIIYVQNEGFKEEVSDVKEPEKNLYTPQNIHVVQMKFRESGGLKGLKGWIREFIDKGTIPDWADGRNQVCYSASIKLLVRGVEPKEVFDIIWQSPFEKGKGKDAYTKKELELSVESARKWIVAQMKKGDPKNDAKFRRENAKKWLKEKQNRSQDGR